MEQDQQDKAREPGAVEEDRVVAGAAEWAATRPALARPDNVSVRRVGPQFPINAERRVIN
jgi:hypothetical protein